VSLRTRLTLAGGGAVLAALAIASLVIYFSVRSKLHDQIDVSLFQTAQNLATKTNGRLAAGGKLPGGTYAKGENPGFPTAPLLGQDASGYFQIVPSLGAALKTAPRGSSGSKRFAVVTPSAKEKAAAESVKKLPASQELVTLNSFVPLTSLDAAVATGQAAPYFRDAVVAGVPMRIYAMRLSTTGDGLVRTARPLTEANATIGRVRWLLIGLTLGGALLAAVLGRLAAGAVLRPVRSLAGTVRDVTLTRDLHRRIAVEGRDELASLAVDFNAMFAALEESQRAQQQLIADASHELRTPLTAHRANVELLARADLPAERRPRVLGAAVRGIEELSALVDDVIQAARDGRSLDSREPIALDELVGRSVERARSRAPGLRFETELEPSTVSAAAPRLERAIDNVLDNAVKWSPDSGSVEVRLADGLLTVRDHGPGIDEADLPHVYDRFYRAAAARGLPGSGLGLAIVKQTVDDHGGTVSVENAPGGGVLVSLRFE
jgi:two-component system sensor histidine kinase MprB